MISEEEIRSIFAKNWVFRIFSKKPWYLLIAAIALLPLFIGMLLSIPLGVFQLYTFNFLTYSGPMIIILSLSAYYWFYVNFPRKLETILSAIDENPTELRKIVILWANKLANNNRVMVIAGIPIGLVGAIDTITLWSTPTKTWIGTPWVVSPKPLFFALIYAFYYVLVMGFLLGSGVVGIVGTGLTITHLFRKPIKLECYRRLRAVADLSLGVGTWAFLAFAIIIVASTFIKPSSNDMRVALSSLLLSFIASLALLAAFLSPLLPARQAILRAKKEKLTIYEERLFEISKALEDLIAKSMASKTRANIYTDEIELLCKERSLIVQQIREIEAIPNWPVAFGSIARFTATAFITPFLGEVPTLLINLIRTNLR